MVWGVIMPSGFGDYFPDGEFDVFDELLTQRFNAMPPEEKALYPLTGLNSYIRHVYEKFVRPQGSTDGSNPRLGPIADHEWPPEYALQKRYSSLGSLLKMNNRLLAVDETLKDIIERVEPGVHLFRRVIITMPRGVIYQMPYYTLVIGRFLDSFDPDKCDAGSVRRSAPYYAAVNENKQGMKGIAFSKGKFGGAHLWRELNVLDPDICMSDTLMAEISKTGLRLPKHYQMKEV